MYAYGFWPRTIPKDYYNFMVNMGNVPSKILKLHDLNVRSKGENPNLKEWLSLMKKYKAIPSTVEILEKYVKQHNGKMPMVPCVAL